MKLHLKLFLLSVLVKYKIVYVQQIPYSLNLISCNILLFFKLKINLNSKIWDQKRH